MTNPTLDTDNFETININGEVDDFNELLNPVLLDKIVEALMAKGMTEEATHVTKLAYALTVMYGAIHIMLKSLEPVIGEAGATSLVQNALEMSSETLSNSIDRVNAEFAASNEAA